MRNKKNNDIRTCNVCGETKHRDEFYTVWNNIRKTYYTKSACKSCNNAKSKAWRDANRDKVQAMKRRESADKQTVIYRSAKARAKKQGIPFSITKHDVVIPSHCPLLGIKLEAGKGSQSPSSPSLDKVIPELGYVPGNVKVVSYLANTMKNNATPEQLLTFASNIKNYIA